MHNNKMQTRDSKKLKVKGEAEKKKRSQKSISKVQAKPFKITHFEVDQMKS